MNNSEKNQESKWRELSRAELKALCGGATFRYIYIDGEWVLVVINE